MANFLSEKQVHDKIIGEPIVQDGLKNILNIHSDFQLIHEDSYINGIIADFTLVHDNKIKSIIEVKGENINVTDYVRGIGQIYQYEYFNEKNITPKSIPYDNDFSAIYLFPDTVLINNTFNVARFKYPLSAKLLELNCSNNAIREITKTELNVLENAEDKNIVSISQYYFRDNRLFEYYMLLRYLLFLNQLDKRCYSRKETEDNFLRKIKTINNKNWRNAFITLSSLGLINSRNELTLAGKSMAILEYEHFAVKMYKSYIRIYAEQFYDCFKTDDSIISSNGEISSSIKSKFEGRDVLFLTESKNRYISSWLNILRDDFGIISFKAKGNKRTLNYLPHDLTDEAFAKKIKEKSVAYVHIEKYNELIKQSVRLHK